MLEIKEDRDFIVTDDDGNEHLFKIYFYFHNDQRNRDYYFLYEESSPDELFVAATEDGNTLIVELSDEEMDEADQVLEAYEEDPNIAEAK